VTQHIDVQLYSQSVQIEADEVPGVGQLVMMLSHPVFDEFAEKVAEAARNKRGLTLQHVPAVQIRPGDHLMGASVIGVRSHHPSPGLVTINLDMTPGHLIVSCDRILSVESPIQ
jgi:hypothetical protein